MKTIIDYTNKLNQVFDRKKKILSANLAAGSTTVTFTDASLTQNAVVDIYTDVYGLAPTSVDDTTAGTLVLTFKAQLSVVAVKLVIREAQ